MRKSFINSGLLMILVLSFSLLLGCSKERPYDEKYKRPELTAIAHDFDTDAEYLYVPMTMGSPRKVTNVDPFFQGQEKIVKIGFKKDGLHVYAPDTDGRFSENSINANPVLRIPGRFIDYRCQENDLRECSDREEENTELEWYQKSYFIPELEQLSVTEINSLDLWATPFNCASVVSTNLVDYTIEKGVINVELEKVYKVSNSFSCLNRFYNGTFDNFSFKARFFYSLVRLDDVASPDYEPIDYEYDEHTQFGFFKTETNFLDEHLDRPVEKYLMHRWNPNREKIVYYLSDTFDKPQNKLIKDATIKAVDSINRSLRRANTKFHIELRDPAGKSAGDLRYNMLVLMDEPLDNGLLGYGPSVVNPKTGEIVQAHVNMYSGVLTRMTRRVYQHMVDVSIDKRNLKTIKAKNANNAADEEGEEDNTANDNNQPVATNDNHEGHNHAHAYGCAHTAGLRKEVKNRTLPVKRLSSENFLKESMSFLTEKPESLENQAPLMVRDVTKAKDNDFDLIEEHGFDQLLVGELDEERIERWTKNNAYPIELFNISSNGKTFVPGIFDIEDIVNEDGTLKRWGELTDSQKTEATKLILPYTYTTTLIHEFGHNLGLRHNFNGSTDKDNFYQENELKALGITKQPAYSSIMDYGYSELNELPVFGKYDVAALRFAYAREVEIEVEGQTNVFQKIAKGEKLKSIGAIKRYDFCTDEHAGLNAFCNRFDEGSTLEEISTHYKDRHFVNYRYGNFRDEKRHFSMWNYARYSYSKFWHFKRFRKVLESFEDLYVILNDYNEKYDDVTDEMVGELLGDGCSEATLEVFKEWWCDYAPEVAKGTKIIGEMMLDIVKMPEHECAIASKDNPTEIAAVIRPRDVYNKVYSGVEVNTPPTTCFIPELESWLDGIGYTIIGERGQYITHLEEENSKYRRYVGDLSALGIWPDKLVAMKHLVSRRSYSTSVEWDKLSYLDHPTIGPKVKTFLTDLALNREITDGVPFKDKEGQVIEQYLPYKIGYDDTYTIMEQASTYVIWKFGLPWFDSVRLNKMMLHIAINEGATEDPEKWFESKQFLDSLTVNRSYRKMDEKYVAQLFYNDQYYSARTDNVVAHQIITDLNKFYAARPSNYDFLPPQEKKQIDNGIKSHIEQVYNYRINYQLTKDERGETFDDPLADETLNAQMIAEIQAAGAVGAAETVALLAKVTPEQATTVYTFMAASAAGEVTATATEYFTEMFPENAELVATLSEVVTTAAGLSSDVQNAVVANVSRIVNIKASVALGSNILEYFMELTAPAEPPQFGLQQFVDFMNGDEVMGQIAYDAYYASAAEKQIAMDILLAAPLKPASYTQDGLFEVPVEELKGLVDYDPNTYLEILINLPSHGEIEGNLVRSFIY